MKLTARQRKYIVDSYIQGIQQIDIASKLNLGLYHIVDVIKTSYKLRTYMDQGVKKRICTVCLNHKEENDTNYRFKKDRGKFQSQCKDCLSTMQKVKRRDMSEEEKTQRSEWSLNFYYKNRESILEKTKEYNTKNRKTINARGRSYTKTKALEKIKQLRKELGI